MNNFRNDIEMKTSNNYVNNYQIDINNWHPCINYPAIVFAKVGAALLLDRKRIINHPFLIDNNLMAFIPYNEIVNIEFIYNKFLTLRLARYARIGALPSFNSSDLKNISICISNDLEEQRNICNIVNLIQLIITLNQRKIENLKELKQYYLQKLFADQNGYPEMRFKKFKGVWEQRKLEKLGNYRRGSFPQPYGDSRWYDSAEGKPFVQVADVTDDYKLAKNTKYKISKIAEAKSVFMPKDTLIVTLQGTIGRVAITQYDAFFDRTILVFQDLSDEVSKYFLLMQLYLIFKKEKQRTHGGTIKTIPINKLNNFQVNVPALNEQRMISTFFRRYNKLIALNQLKLDKLQKLKQFYLDNLFI